MNSRQLADWENYYSLRPHGEDLFEIYFARFLQMFANVNRNPKKPAFKHSEFFEEFEPKEKKLDINGLKNYLRNAGLKPKKVKK